VVFEGNGGDCFRNRLAKQASHAGVGPELRAVR
jgi:hypothetical protein